MLDSTLLPYLDAPARFSPPAMRDRLPTLPFDLSEYARVNTGPDSWSAQSNSVLGQVHADAFDAVVEEIASGPLVGIHGSDVPRAAVCVAEPEEADLSDEEAFVFGLIDGRSCVEDLLAIAGMPPSEVLAAFCSLCARGMVRMR
jgi:hypothetical protein